MKKKAMLSQPIVVLGERFAPTVSAGLYDWEGRDVR